MNVGDIIQEMRMKGPGFNPFTLLSAINDLSLDGKLGPNTRITDIEVLIMAYRKYVSQYVIEDTGK